MKDLSATYDIVNAWIYFQACACESHKTAVALAKEVGEKFGVICQEVSAIMGLELVTEDSGERTTGEE